jgi:hypothetical protein
MIQLGLHLTQINPQGTSISTTPELLQHPLTSQGLLGHLLDHLVLPCQAPIPLSSQHSPPADRPRHHVPQSRNHLGTIQEPSRHQAILVPGTIYPVKHIKTLRPHVLPADQLSQIGLITFLPIYTLHLACILGSVLGPRV